MNDELNFETEEPKKAQRKKFLSSLGHFSIIDALIILIVAAVLIVVISAYSGGGNISFTSEKATIMYTVEIEGIDPALASSIAVGDGVVDENGYSLGAVAAGVEVDSFFEISYDPATGEVISSEHPRLSNILITITAEAEIDSIGGYVVDGRRIAVGAEYQLDLPGFEGRGRCISIIESNPHEGGDS